MSSGQTDLSMTKASHILPSIRLLSDAPLHPEYAPLITPLIALSFTVSCNPFGMFNLTANSPAQLVSGHIEAMTLLITIEFDRSVWLEYRRDDGGIGDLSWSSNLAVHLRELWPRVEFAGDRSLLGALLAICLCGLPSSVAYNLSLSSALLSLLLLRGDLSSNVTGKLRY